MLLLKKHKNVEEKAKPKAEAVKKIKKTKNSSPSKLKVTPEKVHKKDENVLSNRTHIYNQTQPLDFHKLKEKQPHRPSNTKKSAIHDNKSKLLTTSPVLFERSTSHSHKKSKDKSKQRSTSRIKTTRSIHKQKDPIKSVTKRLYTQAKENSKHRQTSKFRSKSRTKIRGDKDVSPLKEIKRSREFNVTDREIKLKGSEPLDQRKSMKKKIRNKMKGEQLEKYPQTDRVDYESSKQEPKMKLKKKVPQIKTEFSQRRGSYFDENLLKKLELGQSQLRKIENSPFIHIKSNFQYKLQNGNAELTSRSEIKTYDEPNWESLVRSKQLQSFKKEQELKWSSMLLELQNLKNQKKVPQKIDELIKQLNDNYSSLQGKVSNLGKNSFEKSKEEEKKEEGSGIAGRQEQTSSVEDDDGSIEYLHYASRNERQPIKEEEKSHCEIEDIGKIQQACERKEEKKEGSVQEELSFIQKLPQDNELIANNLRKQPQSVEQAEQIEKLQAKIMEEEVNSEAKKVNNISLDNDFYDFFDSSKKKLRLQILQNSPTEEAPSNQKVMGSDLATELECHKESDKNLLQELDLFEVPSKLFEVVSISKSNKSEFEEEMQSIRQIQSEQFQNLVAFDFAPHFQNQMKMPEEMSSESILLRSYECIQEVNPRINKIISQIQQLLMLQFCTTILRTKSILHNFLTTYTELVDAKIINNQDMEYQPRPSVDSSNEHVMTILKRLLNHIEIDMKNFFMRQIKIPFECKPIEILKFMRCIDDEPFSSFASDRGEEEKLIIPFFGPDKIEQFEQDILRNEYYIPNYFSFNHSIYDLFNDTVDELRPFGSKGKSIFSLQLSHPLSDFNTAKQRILARVQQTLAQPYYQQSIAQYEKYTKQEGVFQIVYFTCSDLIEEIFELQTLFIYQVFNKHGRGINFL